jgi:hypothetical protein
MLIHHVIEHPMCHYSLHDDMPHAPLSPVWHSVQFGFSLLNIESNLTFEI